MANQRRINIAVRMLWFAQEICWPQAKRFLQSLQKCDSGNLGVITELIAIKASMLANSRHWRLVQAFQYRCNRHSFSSKSELIGEQNCKVFNWFHQQCLKMNFCETNFFFKYCPTTRKRTFPPKFLVCQLINVYSVNNSSLRRQLFVKTIKLIPKQIKTRKKSLQRSNWSNQFWRNKRYLFNEKFLRVNEQNVCLIEKITSYIFLYILNHLNSF